MAQAIINRNMDLFEESTNEMNTNEIIPLFQKGRGGRITNNWVVMMGPKFLEKNAEKRENIHWNECLQDRGIS